MKIGDPVVPAQKDARHTGPGRITAVNESRGHVYVRWADGSDRKHYPHELSAASSLPIAVLRTALGRGGARDAAALEPGRLVRVLSLLVLLLLSIGGIAAFVLLR